MSIKEYDEADEELRVKHENLTKTHDDHLTRHEKFSVEHEKLKASHKELECSLNEKVPSNTPSSHDGSTCVVKVNASTTMTCLPYLVLLLVMICLLLRLTF